MPRAEAVRMPRSRAVLLLTVLFLSSASGNVRGAEGYADNIIVVTIDGLRWQEVFLGADARLIHPDAGVRDEAKTRQRFWSDDDQERPKQLMPFVWEVMVRQGQLFGDATRSCEAHVTNGRYFSYPGYNEILAGYADENIRSNDKVANSNVTVLEWLNRRPPYQGHVAAFASWDVFPFILNASRSDIHVNAGWQPLNIFEGPQAARWQRLADELPHYWDNVRYDLFTFRGALEYFRKKQPRVLYVALGETDDWAHAGRYDLYLDAARRSDNYIRLLWDEVRRHEQFRGKTALVVTTDHGRGDGRQGWKSHGTDYDGSQQIWVGVLGPQVEPLGVRTNVSITQAQVAATIAQLLGEDFAATDPRIAPPLPLK